MSVQMGDKLSALFRAQPYAPKVKPRIMRMVMILTLLAGLGVIALNALRLPVLPDATASEAARQMLVCLEELKAMRLELGYEIDPVLDPAGSGLIGVDYTDLTTTLGDIRAKQTSLNPQFAALIVHLLRQAGARPGDKVALSFSGSFPALNVAAMCACQALELEPLLFSSVGASTYGANLPGFTWQDMEKRLYDRGLVNFKSTYASLGGIVDTGGGIDETGFQLGEEAIARNGALYIQEGGPRDVVRDVRRRFEIYTEGGKPAAYVSVGGNITALGWVNESALLDNGLLTRVPQVSSEQRGLLFRMFEAGVPVINMLNIERLASEYYLPIAPATLSAELDYQKAWRQRAVQLGLLVLAWLALASIFIYIEKR